MKAVCTLAQIFFIVSANKTGTLPSATAAKEAKSVMETLEKKWHKWSEKNVPFCVKYTDSMLTIFSVKSVAPSLVDIFFDIFLWFCLYYYDAI